MTGIFEIFKQTPAEAIKVQTSVNVPHLHDFEELIIGIDGQLEHFIDFNTAIYDAPYISFVTKGKLHRVKPIIYKGECSAWVIRFRSEFIAETTFQLYSLYHDSSSFSIRPGISITRLISLCEMIYEEFSQPIADYSIIKQLLVALFTMIESEKRKLQPSENGSEHTQGESFKKFLQILETHYREQVGVNFYAEKLFMSNRNLNLICQKILHQSVSEIIETRKLIEAKNLLISTSKTISEIGFELGYNEKSYFTSVFKKKNGQTPSEFREEMRGLVS